MIDSMMTVWYHHALSMFSNFSLKLMRTFNFQDLIAIGINAIIYENKQPPRRSLNLHIHSIVQNPSFRAVENDFKRIQVLR